MSDKISHLDKSGNPQMVDVSHKNSTPRKATAVASVLFPPEVAAYLSKHRMNSKKGPIVQTAIIAGNMAVKKTSELIPLCHPLAITGCKIEVSPLENDKIDITCTVKTNGQTGVEMEALTGASITALTIYDMTKALSHHIIIEEVKLKEKTGGKSDFHG